MSRSHVSASLRGGGLQNFLDLLYRHFPFTDLHESSDDPPTHFVEKSLAYDANGKHGSSFDHSAVHQSAM